MTRERMRPLNSIRDDMLLTDRYARTELLTLNRPDKRNALHPDLLGALASRLAELRTDREVQVIVLTGSGSSFSAGLDLLHLSGLDADDAVAYMRSAFAVFRAVYFQPQPVIAAVNGPAIAGGFDLAAFCDIRVCSPAASFGQAEILLGLTQIMYPVYLSIGFARAKELALTGEAITAEEAHQQGLVSHVWPAETLLDRALQLASTIATRPPHAVIETKRLGRELLSPDFDVAFDRMFETISERLRSAEHGEALQAHMTRLKTRRASADSDS